MKCRPEEMVLFELDYGDLIRAEFHLLPSRGWGQCTNRTAEYLLVYGPKHPDERSIFDTSPYVLPPGATTPDRWDCDGFFLPSDRTLARRAGSRHGPLAIKFWNSRRFWVEHADTTTYKSSWDNGIFEPSQINWAIPDFTYAAIVKRANLKSKGAGGKGADKADPL